jgi:hypothetical protein
LFSRGIIHDNRVGIFIEREANLSDLARGVIFENNGVDIAP